MNHTNSELLESNSEKIKASLNKIFNTLNEVNLNENLQIILNIGKRLLTDIISNQDFQNIESMNFVRKFLDEKTIKNGVINVDIDENPEGFLARKLQIIFEKLILNYRSEYQPNNTDELKKIISDSVCEILLGLKRFGKELNYKIGIKK